MNQFYETLLRIAVFLLCFAGTVVDAVKCYSCASENLETDFRNRQRRPPGTIVNLPQVFDNNCDSDIWILRAKASVDCPGACYKWQQRLNNSGVYSYMTVRACYEHMFGTPAPSNNVNECTNTENPLDCLPEATILDSSCLCKGSDFCNSANLNGLGIGLGLCLVFRLLRLF
uniref:Protein quiver n=1 Tax=Panagrellus redivivus TaxID=6233 RepID=A0A7E4W7B5_PANRE